jgi:hypothetical protein
LLISALAASTVDGQTLYPNVVTFLPSANHDSIGPGAQPMVSGYALEIYRKGNPAVALVVELGKPAPSPDGYIHADLGSRVTAALADGDLLEARVVAIGPGGVSRSPLSNLFVLNGCSYLLVGSASFPAAGGPLDIAVQAPAWCAWDARTVEPWLTIDAASTLSGTGTLRLRAAPNRNGDVRLGSVAVGPQLLLVFQLGATVSSDSAITPPGSATTAPAITTSKTNVTAPIAVPATAVETTASMSGHTASGIPLDVTVAMAAPEPR